MSISSTFAFVALSLAFSCGSFFTYALRDVKASNDLISDICSKTTINPSYCEKTLRLDPRSRGANLTRLGHIAINLAQIKAISAAKLVKSLENKAKDPLLKERYSSCLENYEDTADNFNDCRSSLNSKDYLGLASYAAAALDGPVTCDDNFATPPAESRRLKRASPHVQELCSAILVIANRLLGRDLTLLGHIAINLAQITAISAAKLVQSLEQHAKDPILKERYGSCLENYNTTFFNFGDCRRSLNSKDCDGLGSYAATALVGPDTC